MVSRPYKSVTLDPHCELRAHMLLLSACVPCTTDRVRSGPGLGGSSACRSRERSNGSGRLFRPSAKSVGRPLLIVPILPHVISTLRTRRLGAVLAVLGVRDWRWKRWGPLECRARAAWVVRVRAGIRVGLQGSRAPGDTCRAHCFCRALREMLADVAFPG
jgi:hypothetical protein